MYIHGYIYYSAINIVECLTSVHPHCALSSFSSAMSYSSLPRGEISIEDFSKGITHTGMKFVSIKDSSAIQGLVQKQRVQSIYGAKHGT